MRIQTSVWGEIDIKEEQVYDFAKGLPGFEDENRFALIPWDDTPFFYLQSLKEPELSFLLLDPFLFLPDYSFELPDVDREELEISDQVQVMAMVTIHEQVHKSTMNLLAPIVLNPKKGKGKQVVLHQTGYSTRNLIWTDDQLESIKGGE